MCQLLCCLGFITHRWHCCSVAKLYPTLETPWTAALQSLLSSTIAQSLLKFTSIDSVMLSNHLILCRPLLLLPSVFPRIKLFSNESWTLANATVSSLCVIVCRHMAGPRDCHTEWSKSDREKQIFYNITYMWNLEKWYRWTYLLNRKRDTDIENKCLDTKWVWGWWDAMGDWDWHIYTIDKK